MRIRRRLLKRETSMTFKLRTHQQQAFELANSGGCGVDFKKILLSVTPGGGKSLQPVIFADAMIRRGLADKVCWVVPRDNLRKQAEMAFTDSEPRVLLNHSRTIRTAVNSSDPSLGHDGYTTTYQAIAADPDLHALEFKQYRYVLVLDEAQFVEEASAFHRAIQPLVDLCALLVLMTGTPSRSVSGSRIAYLNYDRRVDGSDHLILDDTSDMRVIRYTRPQALSEKVVLPIFFERVDSDARWIGSDGEERHVETLSGIGDSTRPALDTALRKDAAYDLIDRTLSHWKSYRAFNPRSKVLIVARDINVARQYLRKIRAMGFDRFDIATSDMNDDAKRNIDRLKGRAGLQELYGLVTVGMAYVGLDCPQITHIACLTHIRSHEWIEQMLARGTRVDRDAGPYEEQACYAWAPKDDLFRLATDRIVSEQAPFVKSETEKNEDITPGPKGGGGGIPLPSEGITPLSASATTIDAYGMQGEPDVSPQEFEIIQSALRSSGMEHLPPPRVKALLQALGGIDLFACAGMAPAFDATRITPGQVKEKDLVPSEREALVKKRLHKLCMKYVRLSVVDHGDRSAFANKARRLNGEILAKFGSRDNCPESRLHEMIGYVEEKIRAAA